jgi:hypothetical protein
MYKLYPMDKYEGSAQLNDEILYLRLQYKRQVKQLEQNKKIEQFRFVIERLLPVRI